VTIKEIQAKSILRTHKKIDSWFLSRYSMNLYRGCTHNCVYCDGRDEKYQVDGEFGCDVAVKTNAADILQKELDPRRRRVPLKKGYILLGGGVGDSYQPVDNTYQLSRKTLEIIKQFQYPVHILTKSILAARDIDLLIQINDQTKAIVSCSFSSVDEHISSIFEPGVPSPNKRLEMLDSFKEHGLSCGMFLMPVIPFLTDTYDQMEKSIQVAHDHHLDFIIFGGMTLKEGRQQNYFYETIQKNYPDLIPNYHMIYPKANQWGQATDAYYSSTNETFFSLAKKYKMPKRIPLSLYTDIVDENDRVVVILEHLDYLLKYQGQRSPYGYAAYSISQINKPLSSLRYDFRSIKGIGPVTERIINEILDTKTSAYYEKLLYG
jgi:DNA repair photolyase